jgi:predicted nucleic acid-binding protein
MTKRARVRYARGVLDTSTLILLTRMQDESLLPVEPLITTVTLAELSASPLLATTAQERAARQAHVQQAELTSIPSRSMCQRRGRLAGPRWPCAAVAAP